MSKKPSVKSFEQSLMSVPAFWPMAMAAAMMEEGTELYAKNAFSRIAYCRLRPP